MSKGASNWIILFLQPVLRVELVEHQPNPPFVAAGVCYSKLFQEELVSIYDRAIDKSGRLVGFQLWPAIDFVTPLLTMLPKHSYIVMGNSRNVSILLYPGVLSPVVAGDQSMLGEIYASSAGEVAICIDLSGLQLSDDDLRAIGAAAVDVDPERTKV